MNANDELATDSNPLNKRHLLPRLELISASCHALAQMHVIRLAFEPYMRSLCFIRPRTGGLTCRKNSINDFCNNFRDGTEIQSNFKAETEPQARK